ncbi:MAG TPA: hypothetical protein VNI20_11670 [Fimbriimonadaceae bacterium]|nr:hypothetical protein [Fimbriimonadaceae bacterium]
MPDPTAFKILDYKVHDRDFLRNLAISVLDGNAMVNWGLEGSQQEIAFLPVKQATPQQIAKLHVQCGGLFFFATLEWALPQSADGVPIFHTIEPLSREECDIFVTEYIDEKARRTVQEGRRP